MIICGFSPAAAVAVTAAIVSDLVRYSIHACIAPGWLAGWRVESRESRGDWDLWTCGLVALWSCGYDRRASSGRAWGGLLLDGWIVGSLAGWRKEGKKGSRFKYIELDSLGSARGCEDARSACVRVRTGSVTGLYTEIIGIGSRKQRTVTVD